MQKCAVYSAVHRETGHGYVGISVRHAIRWKEHRRAALRGSQLPFHRALRKYGADAFDWQVIAWSSVAGAHALERVAVALGLGHYNLTEGGQGSPGRKHSPAAVEKIRSAARRRQPRTGWNHSPAAKEKMAACRRGKPISDATKALLRAASSGRTHPPEVRARISAALRGRRCSAEHRKNISKARKARIRAD